MATITALKFDTAEGADEMEGALQGLEQQGLIMVQDAAIVSWPAGAKKPKTHQLYGTTRMGALDGAFWGLLFGLLFFVPVAGLVLGAAGGALVGHFTDVGIDDDFIRRVRGEVTEGTSALFLLTSAAVPDRLAEEVKNAGMHFQLIASNLPQEEEAKLRETFSA